LIGGFPRWGHQEEETNTIRKRKRPNDTGGRGEKKRRWSKGRGGGKDFVKELCQEKGCMVGILQSACDAFEVKNSGTRHPISTNPQDKEGRQGFSHFLEGEGETIEFHSPIFKSHSWIPRTRGKARVFLFKAKKRENKQAKIFPPDTPRGQKRRASTATPKEHRHKAPLWVHPGRAPS